LPKSTFASNLFKIISTSNNQNHQTLKTIYFCRHAKSSWDNPDWTDLSRPLNERGLLDAPKMAALLANQVPKIDLLLVSPANRTQQTAQFYAAALGIAPAQIRTEACIYEAYPADIYTLVQGLDAAKNTAVIIGHNPSMTQLYNAISPEGIANIPTCGIFKVEYTVTDWAHCIADVGAIVGFWYPKGLV
jgi:phosphohistidine phosphatase